MNSLAGPEGLDDHQDPSNEAAETSGVYGDINDWADDVATIATTLRFFSGHPQLLTVRIVEEMAEDLRHAVNGLKALASVQMTLAVELKNLQSRATPERGEGRDAPGPNPWKGPETPAPGGRPGAPVRAAAPRP